MAAFAAQGQAAPDPAAVANPGFEQGDLAGWKGWRTKQARVSPSPRTGSKAVQLGPERGRCAQEVKVLPSSRYRLSAWVKTDAGSEEVQLIASDYGGVTLSASSARTEYTRISVEFETASTVTSFLVTLQHPNGPGTGHVDDVELEYLGEAPPPAIQEFVVPAVAPVLEEGGVAQLPAEAREWFHDAKFGLFIHWGVYAAMDEGAEWVMHDKAYTPEYYRKRAEDPEQGFTGSAYDPADWAALAKAAGMRYVVLTTRHHDGYALFDSRHPNAWTSVQHLGRDFIQEYTEAVRAAGLHVGLYYSPMSWRYPGYFDVTGEQCKPNVWGYTTAAWHRENARLMKDEVYEQVTRLLSDYGPIDLMFWDGGWLGQSVDAELEDRFWDSGATIDPSGDWLIDEAHVTRDPATGVGLGIMGLVRHFQPGMLVNERFGWIGDIHAEEGVSLSAGPIRVQATEKCMPLMKGGWGYRPDRPVFSFEEIAVHLADCAIRNINFLLNVSPDRHGRIPDNQREVLMQVGAWMDRMGEAIHGTRGGPWQPRHGEYGFTWKDRRIFAFVLPGYPERNLGVFTSQSVGSREVEGVKDLRTGTPLEWRKNPDNTLTVTGIDHVDSPPVTVLEIRMKDPVY